MENTTTTEKQKLTLEKITIAPVMTIEKITTKGGTGK
jgi:hypothetical protein